MVRQSASNSTLHTVGALTTGFSLIMGLLVLFVIPGNAYFSGIVILILGLTLAVGLFIFLLASVLQHKDRGVETNAKSTLQEHNK